jgi:hypothetical protein
MVDWFWKTKEWVFSGIGVFVLGGVVWMVRRLLARSTPPSVKQTQRSGDDSTNIQAGRDIKIDGGKFGG